MQNKQRHSGDPLSHSMTDLMTSLAVIFILLLVCYMNQNFEDTQRGSHNRLLALKNKIDAGLKVKNIECEYDEKKDPLSCTVRVRDKHLSFDTGADQIKPTGQDFLKWLGPRLTGIICSPEYKKDVESVFIQGFTDSRDTDENNLSLSQNRSFAVMKYTLNNTNLLKQERDCLLNVASTNGRGERDLVYTNKKENQDASRRVEFKIRVKSVEQRQQMKAVEQSVE